MFWLANVINIVILFACFGKWAALLGCVFMLLLMAINARFYNGVKTIIVEQHKEIKRLRAKCNHN